MLTEAGQEWIVDALGCRREALRDRRRLASLLDRLVSEAELHPLLPAQWHTFPGEGGVTALLMLSESHVALHTFPELGVATFNLYCCRPRGAWPWKARLIEHLAAREVVVRTLPRGSRAAPTLLDTPGEGPPCR